MLKVSKASSSSGTRSVEGLAVVEVLKVSKASCSSGTRSVEG